jgi:hypothetical protein
MNGVAEELQGVGKILLGGVEVGEVVYSIRVQRAGLKGWHYPFARFRQRGYIEFYDLLGKPVTLILEDGRRWDCCIKTLDGSVVAVGDWPAKEGARDPSAS